MSQIHCVTTQKGADLIYNVAEAWNNATRTFITVLTQACCWTLPQAT